MDIVLRKRSQNAKLIFFSLNLQKHGKILEMNSVKRCNKVRYTTRKNDIGQFSKSLLFMSFTDHNKKNWTMMAISI